MTRCKFICESKKLLANGVVVELLPVTTGSEENKSYFIWTPFGNLTMGLLSIENAEQFVPGKEYYIDIIGVKEEKS